MRPIPWAKPGTLRRLKRPETRQGSRPTPAACAGADAADPRLRCKRDRRNCWRPPIAAQGSAAERREFRVDRSCIVRAFDAPPPQKSLEFTDAPVHLRVDGFLGDAEVARHLRPRP